MPDLQAQVAAFCARNALLPYDSTIVVAVSGGPDSLCLLHVLRDLAPRWRLRLHVAHLDHQLRPESADDARFVAELAAAWNLPVTIGQADVARIANERHTGIEATARDERLRFLIDTARQVGAAAIALGHTADDQAETVILRLLRGAGPSGLAAMRPKRPADATIDANLTLIRPLLQTNRSEVEAYCRAHALTPRYDSTNSQPIYLRNSVRGYILPLLKTYNAHIIATLGRTARVCADEDDLLADLTEQAWTTLAVVDEAGIRVDRMDFDGLHRALQRRVLRKAVGLLQPNVELEAKHLDLMLAAIAAHHRRVQLPGGLWLEIGRTELRLACES